MPTLAGFRRRGYTPEAIRDFCARIGIAKKENVIDVALLEHTVREDLNRRARRALVVIRPLRVVIENYPEDRTEAVVAVNNPEDLSTGSRQVPFPACCISSATTSWKCRRRSFPALAGRRGPPSLRLHPEVRAGRRRRGEIELRATIDPESLSGATAARRVKGTIHWVSGARSTPSTPLRSAVRFGGSVG